MTSTSHGVLVGCDGSPDSERALLWAAREARRRGTVLTVCHACTPEEAEAAPGDGRAADQEQAAGDQCLAEALFQSWRRDDPTFSFRWDPAEEL